MVGEFLAALVAIAASADNEDDTELRDLAEELGMLEPSDE
jgi:hypothetical protein